MSGYADQQGELGVFLEKPFDADALLDAVTQALGAPPEIGAFAGAANRETA